MKKLWHSFIKELLLSSRSFYFYLELIMAVIMIFILVFVIPENFSNTEVEYIYLDMNSEAREMFINEYFKSNDNILAEEPFIFELDNEEISAIKYSEADSEIFLFEDEQAMIDLAEKEREFAAVIHLEEGSAEVTYTYYLQGYETQRLKNIYLVLHNGDIEALGEFSDAQEVRSLNQTLVELTDRENMVPAFITFNGSLMGLFIISSYIYLDKKEGVIKAYAVSPSTVANYLLSKIMVLMTTSTVTTLLIVIAVKGFDFHILLMLALLLSSGFAASALGILLASYYQDIAESFAAFFALILFFMLPNFAYFIPSWNPNWVKFIPSYYMQEGFKEVLLSNPDTSFVLYSSLGFVIGGVLIFLFANYRFKKTLSV
jgi:hypothetical protein